MITRTALFLVLLSSTVFAAINKLTCDNDRPMAGSNVICKCVTPNNMEWQLNDVALSQCTTTGLCSPQPAGYVFETITTNPDKEYSLTVQQYGYSSCSQYSCIDLANATEKWNKMLSISVFNSTSPAVIVEPGDHKDGQIEITTECLFRESDIVVEWYTVNEGGEEKQYTTDQTYKKPTNCIDTCNGEAAVRLNIGFTHFEEKIKFAESVKFRLKVYHKEDPNNFIDLKTRSNYKIKDIYTCPLLFQSTHLDSEEKCQEDWLKITIPPSVIIFLYISGILTMVLILIVCGHIFCNCFYCWKPKCCVRSARKICDSCKNCNVKGLPFWYRILWLSVIGIPVALGILTVWKVYRICCKNAIRHVLITNDESDGTWSLDASVGAYCVTKVIPGGPADGKLKVGFQIQRINGVTLLGKDQNQVKAMMKEQTKPNVLVSKDGSDTTSIVVLNRKKEEQLGFKYESLANTIKVTEVSQGEGKLEVGDEIHEINGKTVKRKHPIQILAMLNDKEILILDVSEVGSLSTSAVELKREQLGFEYENIAIVTEVTEWSKADGKMEKGDLILNINGKSQAGNSNAEVNKQLKKPPKVMELSIKRAEEENKTIKLDLKGKASLGIAIEKVGENIEVSNIEPQSAAATAAAKISGEIKVGDCILCVNGVSTAGLQVVEIEEMLTFSIILKVTKDVTLKELDPDKDGSFGFETFPPSTSTSVALNKQTTVTSVTSDRPANVVKSVTPNGPAARHGIKAGDTIVSINNEETKGKSHQEIKAMLETFGTSISLKIAENDKPNQTNGHGGNDIEMGHVNPRAQDSGRVQTLETTEEKQDFMKPLLDDKC